MVLIVGGHKVNLLSTKSKTECTWTHLKEVDISDIGDSGSEVSGISWSADGKLAALCGRKWEHIHIIHVDQTDGADFRVDKIPIPSGRYQNCCVFGGKIGCLATAGIGGSVFLWELKQNKWEQVREVSNLTRATVTHMAWDAFSSILCTGDTKGHVTAFHKDDRATDETLKFKERLVDLFNAQGDEVTALMCHPYFPYQTPEVAVGHSTGVLEVWDITKRQLNFTLHKHKSTITDIAYSTINGMLLATASLDCEIHLVSLKSGNVVKRFTENSPILCVEFLRNAQHFVFSTQHSLVTFRLNRPWNERRTEEISGACILRYQQSRGPIPETLDSFNDRVVPSKQVSESLEESKDAKVGKPNNLDKDKSRRPLPKRISDISEIATEDSDCSFNISDIVNYTYKDETPPPPSALSSERLNAHQKRPISGLVGRKLHSEEKLTDSSKVMQSTPEVSQSSKSRGSEGPNKMRRIDETDEGGKENHPPVNRVARENDTPTRQNMPIQTKKPARLVSSTPAVPMTSATKPPFGKPGDGLPFQQSPTPNDRSNPQRTSLEGIHTITKPQTKPLRDSLLRRQFHDSLNRSSLENRDHNSPTSTRRLSMESHEPITSSHITEHKENKLSETMASSVDQGSISSLISSIDTENPSVTDLSNKLKSMGPKVGYCADVSAMTSGLSQNVLTSGTEDTDNTTGGPSRLQHGDSVLLGDTMASLHTLISDVSQLDKTLRSQARWIKTEVVRQACDTQFALEDRLNVMEERQKGIEQRLSNIEQDISFIRDNLYNT